ncbi:MULTISPECIES: hypothetical protein [Pseudescherichia]|uniref:hypothetical protein n=1 Tax=Pseudescherichia TaxID=2055880 RepID=UPI00301E40D3
MKSRGMIFNAEMVRAILDGRKTQTRRIMKNQPAELPSSPVSITRIDTGFQWYANDGVSSVFTCPFGQPGDRIWVREAFRVMGCATDVARLMYKASERNSFTESTRTVPVASCTKQPSQKWTPSIHMPRWASRILLEITDVRVERLNSISEEDARAEGCAGGHDSIPDYHYSATPHEHFRHVWTSIYGEESWSSAWVWVIEFKRVDGGAA